MPDRYPKELLSRIRTVKNKRARIVLDTIVSQGSVTTDDLKKAGYDHPPRAARDVRELGFKLITTMISGPGGKRMASYSLGSLVESSKSGRIQMPKRQRDMIIAGADNKCQICGATHDLQVDHRVPYEIAGEAFRDQLEAYMVLDGTCNRRKSWVCEHCTNFLELRQVDICQRCYWANPEEHSHVGMEPVRRIDVVFVGDETKAFDRFRKKQTARNSTIQAAIKGAVAKLGE